MTRDEADQERDRLAQEHPDRATHSWMTRTDDAGNWSVVKIGIPPSARVDPVKETTESRPPQADDVRDSFNRNVGGPYIA